MAVTRYGPGGVNVALNRMIATLSLLIDNLIAALASSPGGGGAVDSVNGRTGAVTGLAEQSALTSEATARAAADTTLTTNVATNTAAISAETTARTSADSAESTARTSGDAANAAAITAEATTSLHKIIGLGATNNLAAIQASLNAGGTTTLSGTHTVRAPIVVPTGVRLTGERGAKVQKPAAVATLLTANMTAGQTSCTVTDPTIVSVGDGVTIWDTTNDGNNGNVTIGVVTAKVGSVITIDTPAWAAYQTNRAAKLVTTFPLVRNATGATDAEIDHLIFDGQANSADILGSFEGSTISLIGAKRFNTHDCRLLNAASDAYSDQGNDRAWNGTTKTVADNHFHHNTILTTKQHGVHLGTGLDGGRIAFNIIDGCPNEGVHYSNTIENTLVSGNTIRNCALGVASLDGLSPFNTIFGNTITGGATGIEVGAARNCTIALNILRNQTSRGILISFGTQNIIVGNIIDVLNNGIELTQGTHRNTITGNILRGGNVGGAGVSVDRCNDTQIDGNSFDTSYRGLYLYGSNDLVVRGNTFANIATSPIFFEGGQACVDPVLEDNHLGGGTIANLGTWTTRAVVNGMGDNGASNPASAGDWNGVTGSKHTGRIVRWSDGTEHFSVFVSGVGWIASGGGSVADAIVDGVTTVAPSQNAVFDALALTAPLASPALTGNPTAPTASPGDSDTSIATTAFVAAAADAKVTDAIADGVTTVAPSQNAVFDALALKMGALTRTAVKTGNYSAAAGDLVPVDTTAGAVTVTLPTAPANRSLICCKHIIQGGTNAVTIACGGSDVFNRAGGSASATLPLAAQAMLMQYDSSSAVWTIIADDIPLSQLDLRFANLASPAFTGTPTAPTAAPGTSTTQLATTAFVSAAASPASSYLFLTALR